MNKAVFYIIICTMLVLFSAVDFRAKITDEGTLPHFALFYDMEVRKRQFFEFMRPIIEEENERVLSQRKRFLGLYEKRARGEELSAWQRAALERMAEKYRVNPDEYESDAMWDLLKLRIDIVPTELALAQSASESAWGRSRFAVEGNAMFGQWSFSRKRAGMIPKRRDPESSHRVAAFPSVSAAVKSYIRNLNTHSAYINFRLLRSRAREKGSELDAHTLATGLINYSERRKDYVREIQTIIETNKSLMDLDL